MESVHINGAHPAGGDQGVVDAELIPRHVVAEGIPGPDNPLFHDQVAGKGVVALEHQLHVLFVEADPDAAASALLADIPAEPDCGERVIPVPGCAAVVLHLQIGFEQERNVDGIPEITGQEGQAADCGGLAFHPAVEGKIVSEDTEPVGAVNRVRVTGCPVFPRKGNGEHGGQSGDGRVGGRDDMPEHGIGEEVVKRVIAFDVQRGARASGDHAVNPGCGSGKISGLLHRPVFRPDQASCEKPDHTQDVD